MSHGEKYRCSYPGCKNFAQGKGRYCYEHKKISKGKKVPSQIKNNDLDYENDFEDNEFND